MASIESIKASDGSGNASVATVQSTRTAGSTTLVVDTVDGINTNFYGSMGTPHTFTDPVTSETITVISEATAVDFAGHVDGVNLEIDTIAPGYTDNGSASGDIVVIRPTTQWADEVGTILEVAHNDDGTLKNNAVTTSVITDDAVTAAKVHTDAILPENLVSGTGTSWAWQSWTPTWGGLTVGNGTVAAKYTQVGKMVTCRISFTMGSTSSISGDVTFTLPVTSVSYVASGNHYIGVGRMCDNGVAAYGGPIEWRSTTTGAIIAYYAASTYLGEAGLSGSLPFTWGTGDYFNATFTYEAA